MEAYLKVEEDFLRHVSFKVGTVCWWDLACCMVCNSLLTESFPLLFNIVNSPNTLVDIGGLAREQGDMELGF